MTRRKEALLLPIRAEAVVSPQAPELERLVLGAAMLSAEGLADVLEFLEPEHFYVTIHGEVWAAIQGLHSRGSDVDPMTVVQALKSGGKLDGVGGAVFVSRLTNDVASSKNIQSHARIIVQKHMLRSFINLGQRLSGIDDTTDPLAALELLNEELGKLNSITSQGDPKTASEILSGMVDNRAQPLRLALGIPGVDDAVSLGPGDVVVIGARPAVGKTAVALTIARSIASQGFGVAIISLEMSETQLIARLASTICGVDSNRITRNDLTDFERERMAKAGVENGAWIDRIYIDDRATLRDAEVFGLFNRLAKRHNCKAVIIDYMQLMEGAGDTGVAQMSNISKRLKQAGKASGLRVIELSQLKRRPGADTDPEMSDLRESGQIEADGDVILLLGRDKGSDTMRVKLEKHKFGPVGTFDVHYDLATQTVGHNFQRSEPSPFDIKANMPHPDNRIEKTSDDAPF